MPASRQFLRISLALVLVLLLLGANKSFATGSGGGPANDACIKCHSDIYKEALAKEDVHEPFSEKNCTVCHVDDSQAGTGATSPVQMVTGSVVDQEPLWTKSMIFTSSDTQGAQEHTAQINNLDPQTVYRFRIVVGDPDSVENNQTSSQWLGLLLKELSPTGQQSIELTAADSQMIQKASLTSVDGGALFISWHTPVPRSGEVQAEEMAGLEANGQPLPAAAVPTGGLQDHPVLRSPAVMEVKVCYTCHPAAKQNSHPVNLSSTAEVRIPADLPTVNGKMTCVTCHDPHGSNSMNLMRDLIVTKLCVTCHHDFKNQSKATQFH